MSMKKILNRSCPRCGEPTLEERGEYVIPKPCACPLPPGPPDPPKRFHRSEVVIEGSSPSLSCSGIPVVIDPDYSAFIVRARIIAKQEGYALAVHGSTTRDLDLIAVPWTKEARTPQALTARIDFNTGWRRQRADGTRCEIGERVEPTAREHGRLVWIFMPEGFADPRFVDFSVIPPNSKLSRQP